MFDISLYQTKLELFSAMLWAVPKKGHGYDYTLEQVLLAMTEHGNVLCFKATTTDYEIVGHSDFGQIFKSIVEAKTLDFKK